MLACNYSDNSTKRENVINLYEYRRKLAMSPEMIKVQLVE
ncbi:hypothetical protein BARBAKC583_1237 [Bartonella bacilliformis KC583]|uniref:Uncharacterized protein n=1 Tax=Bartonella bacilliformis (strain ATCC 35685 / KC583 / Herrer 020/F12,63) TaxID=360095 RepID=A1UU33_BARBK|nr:hypothetical protein BARBAKC583_1237 [Bartonella bacilliformis KC583]